MFQSVVPPEALLHQQQLPPPELRACCCGSLEGYRNAEGDFVVSRLLSTDPAAFLDSRFQPGQVVKN